MNQVGDLKLGLLVSNGKILGGKFRSDAGNFVNEFVHDLRTFFTQPAPAATSVPRRRPVKNVKAMTMTLANKHGCL